MSFLRFLTIAFGMAACTYVHSNPDTGIKNNVAQTAAVKNCRDTAVVKIVKTTAPATPDLPFFKDVFDAKLLFW